MPNWCMNWMTITTDGAVEERDAVLGRVEDALKGDGVPLDFESVIPAPDGIDDEHGMARYDWCVANWGTKWNVRGEEVHVERRADQVEYVFETAWAPPFPFVVRIAEMFPEVDVTLAYDEPGMDFGGFVYWSGGEIVDQYEGASRMTPWHEEADMRRAFG